MYPCLLHLLRAAEHTGTMHARYDVHGARVSTLMCIEYLLTAPGLLLLTAGYDECACSHRCHSVSCTAARWVTQVQRFSNHTACLHHVPF